jgi:fumarate hydratase class II
MVTENTQDVSAIERQLYGAETEKAVKNFTISEYKMPMVFIQTLALYKGACAKANQELGLLTPEKSIAIQHACIEVEKGCHSKQFPVDVFQTGSGTSTNMNVNEVISALVSLRSGGAITVHPNDDVNKGQSSNDVIPSCIHISAATMLANDLIPSLGHLADALEQRGVMFSKLIKTGRTHLMDAMPMSVAQEFGAWRAQVLNVMESLNTRLPAICRLAVGGTAVGSGINTHPDFANRVTKILSDQTGLHFSPAENLFSAISSQDTAVNLSGDLKTVAVCMNKIANDIRWLSSGPLNGLHELILPELQKGSSIMPGKVNPVIPEAVLMACAKVIGNDTTITIAGQGGNFQLNTMLPLIAHTLIESITLLSNSCNALTDKVIAGMQINKAHIDKNINKNPILATALNDKIGYDKSTKIAKQAYMENKTVLEVALAMTDIDETELKALLDPKRLTHPSYG